MIDATCQRVLSKTNFLIKSELGGCSGLTKVNKRTLRGKTHLSHESEQRSEVVREDKSTLCSLVLLLDNKHIFNRSPKLVDNTTHPDVKVSKRANKFQFRNLNKSDLLGGDEDGEVERVALLLGEQWRGRAGRGPHELLGGQGQVPEGQGQALKDYVVGFSGLLVT